MTGICLPGWDDGSDWGANASGSCLSSSTTATGDSFLTASQSATPNLDTTTSSHEATNSLTPAESDTSPSSESSNPSPLHHQYHSNHGRVRQLGQPERRYLPSQTIAYSPTRRLTCAHVRWHPHRHGQVEDGRGQVSHQAFLLLPLMLIISQPGYLYVSTHSAMPSTSTGRLLTNTTAWQ